MVRILNMKKYILILAICTVGAFSSKAQLDLENQLGELSNALPSYFLGYSKVISAHIGMPMAFSSQTQHWKRRWRVKYGLSMAAQVFPVNNYTNGRIDQRMLYRSPSVGYLGRLSNAFGSVDASTLRFYLLNDNGERLINPSNGQYLAADIELPGGYDGNIGAVPFISPSLEIRVWKGIIVSASYMPLSWAMREFEQDNFKLSANFYSFGGGLNLRNFTKIPVLSWFRFDASYGALSIGLNDFQDALSFDNSDLFNIKFNSVNLTNNVSYLQYRGSLAIPLLKKAVLIIQGGAINSTFNYNFNHELVVEVDATKIKEDYNIDVDSDNIIINKDFSYTEDVSQNFYYGAGLLFDTRVATFFLGYAELNSPTFIIKSSLRLL